MYKNTVAMCTFIVNNFDTDIKNTCIKERCAHTNKNYCKNNFDTDTAPYYRGVSLTNCRLRLLLELSGHRVHEKRKSIRSTATKILRRGVRKREHLFQL